MITVADIDDYYGVHCTTCSIVKQTIDTNMIPPFLALGDDMDVHIHLGSVIMGMIDSDRVKDSQCDVDSDILCGSKILNIMGKLVDIQDDNLIIDCSEQYNSMKLIVPLDAIKIVDVISFDN